MCRGQERSAWPRGSWRRLARTIRCAPDPATPPSRPRTILHALFVAGVLLLSIGLSPLALPNGPAGQPAGVLPSPLWQQIPPLLIPLGLAIAVASVAARAFINKRN